MHVNIVGFTGPLVTLGPVLMASEAHHEQAYLGHLVPVVTTIKDTMDGSTDGSTICVDYSEYVRDYDS